MQVIPEHVETDATAPDHRCMTTRTRILRGSIAAATAAAAIASLAGCSLFEQEGLQGTPQFDFASADEARASEEAWRIPRFLSGDATDVSLHVDYQRVGANLRWSSEDGITAGYCAKGPISGETVLRTDWWPDVPADGWDCGRWIAFQVDDTYYAWDQGPQADPEND
ncbi:hypothetical protein [Homoserinibacter sp. YIM 151385]|uniref:hypothetical protein n=1 Tax=Homoserinibacter sp. YIM 151385 TaxID=2985506 RepID=UPI0022F12D88|nr:hypothetical protein [Homoserinibacter sp. YIM 151385]WBU36903.1 hypothetical protein OF852_08140 [Homoserinibacter sp. YIM 151385]